MERNAGRGAVSARARSWRTLSAAWAAVLLVSLLAAPAWAFTINSDRVVVPVVAHLPGLEGTQWRTDVWVQNSSSNTLEVTLSYYPEAGGVQTSTVHLDPYHGAYFHDIVLETFGLESSKGMLIVASDLDVSALEVRARIYNTGNASGEFGQAIPGIPLDRLGRQGFLSGVSTASGTRLSLGIANPTDETFTVVVVVHDAVTNEQLAYKDLNLSPHQLVQLDRLADLWDLPERDIVAIDTYSGGNPYYAYASVVRNDTGDATFIFGTAPNSGPQ